MFETTGQVELAEILFDGTRSKGCGVVQFAQVGEAETAIGAFTFRLDASFVFRMGADVVVVLGCCSQVPRIHVRWTTTGYVVDFFLLRCCRCECSASRCPFQ